MMKPDSEETVCLADSNNFAQLKKSLSESEARFRAIFDKAAIGIILVDTQTGKVLNANPAMEEILGYTTQELKETWLVDITFPEDIGLTLKSFEELRTSSREYHQLEKRYFRKDGELIWVHMTTSLVKDTEGQAGFIFGMIEDITNRKLTEDKLKWNESLLRMMASSSPQAFLIVDSSRERISYFNRRFCQIWGMEDLETPLQNGEVKYNEIISHIARLLKNAPSFVALAEALQDLDNRQVIENEIELRDSRMIRHYSTQMRDEEGGYVGRLHIFEDITERKQLECSLAQAKLEAEKAKEEAERLAFTDYLTGLYNRRAFISMLKMELDRAKRKQESISLILLDVDNFKLINDTYGHLAGDAVLQEISKVVNENLRRYDFVGRYGGEEFIICLPDTTGDKALVIAERIRRMIASEEIPIPESEAIAQVTVSMGISPLGPEEPRNLDLLIKNADIVLYEAKKLGRNRVCLVQ